MYIKMAESAIEKVARRRGVSETVIIEEIQNNIDEAMRSADPLAQARWRQIFGVGKKPTAVEFLAYIAQHPLPVGFTQI